MEKSVTKKIVNFWNGFLNFILPRNAAAEKLSSMTAAEFMEKAPRAKIAPSPDAICLFDYRDPLVKSAIWELKYRGNDAVASLLAECLYDELAEELAERASFQNFREPLLIPIPISAERRKKRGFNQCELLLQKLCGRGESNSFTVAADILRKIKDTESQTTKNRSARLKNLAGCFSVKNPERVKGKNIILLDDVLTTGATLEEAGRTLYGAGAKKIIYAAVARS